MNRFISAALALSAALAGGAVLAQDTSTPMPNSGPPPEIRHERELQGALSSKLGKWMDVHATGQAGEYLHAATFMDCAALSARSQAIAMLSTVVGSDEEMRAIKAVARAARSCPALGSKFTPLYVRGASAESLMARNGPAPAAPASAERLARFDASRVAMPATMPAFVRWQEVADCYVKANPGGVADLLDKAPGSGEERATLDTLMVRNQACGAMLPPDDTSRPSVRALLAEGLYRWREAAE